MGEDNIELSDELARMWSLIENKVPKKRKKMVMYEIARLAPLASDVISDNVVFVQNVVKGGTSGKNMRKMRDTVRWLTQHTPSYDTSTPIKEDWFGTTSS